MGSFYNHFATKDELFDAAVEDAVESFATMDQFSVGMDDSAHVFAQSFRLSGRLHRRWHEPSKIRRGNGLTLAVSKRDCPAAPVVTSKPRPTPGGSPSATRNSL
jgi:AcrR family transcriptional regulator